MVVFRWLIGWFGGLCWLVLVGWFGNDVAGLLHYRQLVFCLFWAARFSSLATRCLLPGYKLVFRCANFPSASNVAGGIAFEVLV